MPEDPTSSTRRRDVPSGVPRDVAAVLLAAGAGTRFAGPGHKLLAEIPSLSGRTVVESALRNVLDAGFDRVVVVTGAVSLPEGILRHDRLVVVHNAHWTSGQASSLRAGIGAAAELGVEAVVVGLADQPFIDPEAWRMVALDPSPIAVATYSGRRGHPVRLHKSLWSDLPAKGDLGARDVIRMRPELVSQVDCPGSATDIDTQEDLAQWT